MRTFPIQPSFFSSKGVLGLLLSALSLSLLTSAEAQEPGDSSGSSKSSDSRTAAEALWTDAAEVAPMYGISVEEARARLERQPRVGALQRALESAPSFGGLFLDQVPEYRIRVLARPGGGAELTRAIEELGFADLEPFVTVSETPFTLDVLEAAMGQVGRLAGGKATTLDVDLRAGEVLATAATAEDVDALRTAIASAAPPVQARRVILEIAGSAIDQHSYGGLALSTCTSGFSVWKTSGTIAEGVTTAAHCQDAQTLQKHSTALDFVTAKEKDSQDVQWHKTPGLTDPNLMNDGGSTPRTITGRVHRSDMVLDGLVCHYGMTSGFGCGEIRSKKYDPDGSGSKFNGTFIRIREDDTLGGDSGGPWFLGGDAYGTHLGITGDSSANPVFMAQNFMAALDLLVKISP